MSRHRQFFPILLLLQLRCGYLRPLVHPLVTQQQFCDTGQQVRDMLVAQWAA